MEHKRHRVRNGVIIGICVAAVAAGLVLWFTRDRTPDPETVALPAPAADTQAVLDYLVGEGKPLVDFLDATAQLSATATLVACTDLAAHLDTLGEPPQLIGVAQAAPDPNIRDAMVTHLDNVGEFLAVCGSGGSLEDPAKRVTFSATVLRRLLDRLGAA
jgi:hypothetical protein